MGIPAENTFEKQNATFDEVKALYKEITLLILARTRKLQQKTGILGSGLFIAGLEWKWIKDHAMKSG